MKAEIHSLSKFVRISDVFGDNDIQMIIAQFESDSRVVVGQVLPVEYPSPGSMMVSPRAISLAKEKLRSARLLLLRNVPGPERKSLAVVDFVGDTNLAMRLERGMSDVEKAGILRLVVAGLSEERPSCRVRVRSLSASRVLVTSDLSDLWIVNDNVNYGGSTLSRANLLGLFLYELTLGRALRSVEDITRSDLIVQGLIDGLLTDDPNRLLSWTEVRSRVDDIGEWLFRRVSDIDLPNQVDMEPSASFADAREAGEELLRSDPGRACKLLFKLARDARDPKCMVLVADLLGGSHGRKWYRRAAVRGMAEAALQLAQNYRLGLYATVNALEREWKVFKWSRQAVESLSTDTGKPIHAAAYHNLACYYNTYSRDFATAQKLWRRAAELGSENARLVLSRLSPADMR